VPESVTTYESDSARDPAADGALLLAALTSDVDGEFKLAERLDAKIQRSATFAGGFFALVQAAAITSLLKSAAFTRTERTVLLIAALVALLGLAGAGLALLQQEKLERAGRLPLGELQRLVDHTFGDRPRDESINVTRDLIRIYSAMARERRVANDKRAARYRKARVLFGSAVMLTSLELGWALFARIPGIDV
jgi:hypothetical protein